MSQPIDEAYVEVRPDVDNFAATLSRRLTAALNKVQADVNRSLRQTSDRATAEGGRAGEGFGNEFTRRAGRSFERLQGIVSGAVSGLGTLGKASVGLAGITAAVGTGAAAIAGLASAASAAIPVIVGLATALATTAGVLVAVPGAVAVAAAAIGTLKLGTQGLGDAFEAIASEDADAFNEALKELAPNAQAFARQLQALKPAFDGLRLQVQNALFANTDKLLAALARTTLPTLRAGMTGLAAAINGQVVGALTALNTKANQINLAAVFTAARDIVAAFGPALRPVTQALLDVVRVGAQVTAVFVSGLGAEIGAFAQQISAMAASGELAQMFHDGLSAAGQFLLLAQDILGIFGGIASAAGSGGGGLFAFFDQLNAAINSIAGQAALTELFGNLATIGQALTPVLLAVGQALGPVSGAIGALAVAFAPTLTTLVQALGGALTSLLPGFLALMPLVGTLASALQPLAAILVNLVVGAAPGLNAFLTGLVGALQALAPAAGPVGEALGAVATALAPLLPLIGAQLANVLTVAATALTGMSSQFGPLITMFGNLAAQLAAQLLPILLQLAVQLLPVLAQAGLQLAVAFAPLIPVIAQVAQIFAAQLAAALPGLVASFLQLLPVALTLAQTLGQTLLNALLQLMPQLPTLITQGLRLAQAFTNLLVAVLPIMPQVITLALMLLQLALRTGFVQQAMRVMTVALTFATGAVRIITGVVNALRTPLDAVGNAAGRMGAAIRNGATAAFNAVRGLPGQIKSAVGDLGDLLFGAGKSIITGLVNGIKNAIPGLNSILSSVTSKIPDWKGPLDEDRKLLEPAGKAILGSLVTGLRRGIPELRSELGAVTGLLGGMGVGGQLQSLLSTSAAASAAPLPAVSGVPAVVGSDAGVSGEPIFNVRVYVGDRELKDIIGVEITRATRAEARKLAATPRTP